MSIIHKDANGLSVVEVNTDYFRGDVKSTQPQYIVQLNSDKSVKIEFQHGAPREVGVNGLTNEAFLAILLHRLESLNAREGCSENLRALEGVRSAINALDARELRKESERRMLDKQIPN